MKRRNTHYNPKLKYNLFSTVGNMKTYGIWHNTRENKLLDMKTDKVIGYTYEYR
jgi:hypothetical protein